MALLLGCGLALCCLTVGLCLPGLLLGPLLLLLRLLSLLFSFACTLLCLGTVLCPGGCSSRFFGPLALPFCLLGFLPGFALCLCCASLRLRLSAFGLGHTAGVLLGSFLCRCAASSLRAVHVPWPEPHVPLRAFSPQRLRAPAPFESSMLIRRSICASRACCFFLRSVITP